MDRPHSVHNDIRAFYVTVSGEGYKYVQRLENALSNVIGMELVDFVVPRNIAPPFAFENQFRLTLSGGFLPPKTYTVTLPDRMYLYSAPNEPLNSYVDMLSAILNDVIASDVDWVDKARFISFTDSRQRTSLALVSLFYGGWAGDGSLGFTLDFTIANSPYTQMGFTEATFTSALATNIVALPPVQLLTSPSPTALKPFRYIDVFVDEFRDFSPFARIYIDPELDSVVRNNTSQPTRLLWKPLRRLNTISVEIKLPNRQYPISVDTHDLTFVVFTSDVIDEKAEAGAVKL